MDEKANEKEAALASIADLYTFFRNFWHVNNKDEFIDNWHIKKLCDELTVYGLAIAKREYVDNQIYNIPPGMSKSGIINHCFSVWGWLHNPSTVWLCSCYSPALSEEHSLKAKAIFKSERFQTWYQSYFKVKFGKEISLTKDTVLDWQNNFGGRRYNTYTAGPVIGIHAHAHILDDPMSLEMTYSSEMMAKVHRFNDKSLSTRKKNKDTTPTILVMQRLSVDDTTGHELDKIKDGKKIKHYCLPAQDGDNVLPIEWRQFYVNGLLDPRRCSLETLAKEKLELGSADFNSQYNQKPIDEGGSDIKRPWFIHVNERDVPLDITWDMWIDGAYTDKSEENDPSGIMVCGFHERTNSLYVRFFVGKYLEMPDLLKEIPRIFYLNGFSNKSRAFYEPKASGESLAQMINSTSKISSIKIKSSLVREGKRARVKVASPKYEAGRIKHVLGQWNGEFEDQLVDSKSKHDEARDLIGYATDYYFKDGFSQLGSSHGVHR